MNFLHNIKLAIITFIICLGLFCISIYNYELSSINNNDTVKDVTIESGSISDIANKLYDEKLIRNPLFFKIYIKLTGKSNLKAATYELSQKMTTKEIVNILFEGKGINKNEIRITFKEGLNMRAIANVIENNTNNSSDDVIKLVNDNSYLNNLIDKYWFLTDKIINNDIYYSLEGYLYPDTYNFSSKDVSIKDILEKMLDEEEKKLEPYKDTINNNKYNIHELLTLASIVELEGTNKENRKGIAGVFYNRLNKNMTLGSDVTTYYGARIDMGVRDLYAKEVNDCNKYNTRCSSFTGLPVSPICNPSIDSIDAVINPDTTDNYYFVADKNMKIYFSKTITEHNRTIANLKKEGLWFEY